MSGSASYEPSVWARHYPDSAAGVSFKPFPLFRLLEHAARQYGQRVFSEFIDHRCTYAEAYELAERLAGALVDLGVAKGDRVGYCVPNHPAMSITLFACWRIGAVAVALNPAYPSDRLKQQMCDAGVKVVVSVEGWGILEKLADEEARAVLPVVVCRADSISLDRTLETRISVAGLRIHEWAQTLKTSHTLPALCVEPSDLAVLMFTGGTTGGHPKAAQLTHANLSMNVQQMRCWFPQLADGGETVLAAAAFTHVAGLGPLNNFAVHLAATMVVQPRFDVERTLERIDAGKLSILLAVPTMLTALLHAAEGRRMNWQGLKLVQSGAAPLTSETRERFHRLSGRHVVNLYGMTETAPAAIYGTQDRGGDPGSVGVPLPLTRVEVRRPEAPHSCAPVGSIGEICIAGPQVMVGYWQREQLNQECFVGEFFRSGDLGYMSLEGLFYVVDRLKDVIIAGGYNIYPALLEDAIGRHPAVAETVVVGIPDIYRGETAVACVVLKPASSLSLEDLRQFLRDKLSPMEIPTQLKVMDDMPKTAAGKLARIEVRARLM